MAKLFVLPNDQYPVDNFTKQTVRHTNFDADGNTAYNEINSRTFSDFEGLGEVEFDASLITYNADFSGSGPNIFRIPKSVLTDRTLTQHSLFTFRAEAGGGHAEYQAGIVLGIFGSHSGDDIVCRIDSITGRLTAAFTGKAFLDSTDGIPDFPSIKKETRKATKASYTVLD